MEQQHFINQFSALLFRTGRESIKPDTCFKDLREWNVLWAVSVIEMVWEEYQVTLEVDDLRVNRTVGELYDCICSKQ